MFGWEAVFWDEKYSWRGETLYEYKLESGLKANSKDSQTGPEQMSHQYQVGSLAKDIADVPTKTPIRKRRRR